MSMKAAEELGEVAAGLTSTRNTFIYLRTRAWTGLHVPVRRELVRGT